MLAVMAATLAGSCLLLSAQRGMEPGHIPWASNSMLRVVTTVLALDFAFPTSRGAEIKTLVAGLGTAVLLAVVVSIWYARQTHAEHEFEDDEIASADPSNRQPRQISPKAVAISCLVAFTAWMFISALWSPWQNGSMGEAFRQMILTVWAIVLGTSLRGRAVRRAALLLCVILTVTAGLGLWYYHVRNPVQRLKFPIGNPIFMAACLLPGLSLMASALVGGSIAMLARGSAAAGGRPGGRGRAIMIPGAIAGLVVLGWAFHLTDSRGPMLGLLAGWAAGAVAAGFVAIHRRLTGRRRRIAWLLASALVLAGAAHASVKVWHWLEAQKVVEQAGRGASFRLRLYAMGYARDLILERPLIGHGQGSYALRVQAMVPDNLEQDPAAFAVPTLAHAHNEWLEVLADLGLVGGLLCGGMLLLTVWGGIAALARARDWGDRIVIVGLIGALAAVVVEELSDVALRKPGLPILFHTVLGLLWATASSKKPESPAVPGRRLPRPARIIALVCAIFVSLSIMSGSWLDWQGALAHQQAYTGNQNGEFVRSCELSSQAGQYRLAVEDRIIAAGLLNEAAYAEADRQVGQCRQSLGRLASGVQVSPDAVADVVREDLKEFEQFAGLCEASGLGLLQRVPGMPNIARRIADAQMLRQEMGLIAYQLGLRDDLNYYVPSARRWMQQEYIRDRLNADNALRLLELYSLPGFMLPDTYEPDLASGVISDAFLRALEKQGLEPSTVPKVIPIEEGLHWALVDNGKWYRVYRDGNALAVYDQPLSIRLDLVRLPLRMLTRFDAEFGRLDLRLTMLMQEPGFEETLDLLLGTARRVVQAPGEHPWADPYAPETLRLAARANMHRQRYAEAARLAGQASELCEPLRPRFPRITSAARAEEADYLLMAYPDQAERAVSATREAIEQWPLTRERRDELLPLQHSLVFHLLAAGEENAARDMLTSLLTGATTEDISLSLAEGYAELCKHFLFLDAHARPASFARWLDRCLELSPSSATGLQVAILVALEQNRGSEAIGYLRSFAGLVGDPRDMADYLDRLRQSFPEQTDLQAFVDEWRQANASDTQPATGPETRPHDPVPAPIDPVPSP